MKTQLASLEIHFLLKELKDLEESKVDKIYNNGKEEIYIQFFKSNVGKKLLRIILGKAIFLTEIKSVDDIPSEFCKLLRKHLEGKFLDSIEQIEPERILKFVFKAKDDVRKIYIEFFSKGNLILCNNEDIIIESLLHYKFKDHSIIPKEQYKHPIMDYNIFKLKKSQLTGLLKTSKKDKVVTCLATELGLGGVYSEEVCLLNNIDKNSKPSKIDNKEISKIINSIKKLINNKKNSQIIYKNKEAVDAVSVDLQFYRDFEIKNVSSFNEALDIYFTKELKIVKKEESAYTKQINELERIIEEQKATIENMKNKEIDLREKGELIYHNYQLIKEILDEINKASKKYSWKEIKEKVKDHKIVKDLDMKDKAVVVDIQ